VLKAFWEQLEVEDSHGWAGLSKTPMGGSKKQLAWAKNLIFGHGWLCHGCYHY
jgi:hypothetical protein